MFKYCFSFFFLFLLLKHLKHFLFPFFTSSLRFIFASEMLFFLYIFSYCALHLFIIWHYHVVLCLLITLQVCLNKKKVMKYSKMFLLKISFSIHFVYMHNFVFFFQLIVFDIVYFIYYYFSAFKENKYTIFIYGKCHFVLYICFQKLYFFKHSICFFSYYCF